MAVPEATVGNYTKARKQLQTAARLDAPLSDARYSHGEVHHYLGLTEISQAAYQKSR